MTDTQMKEANRIAEALEGFPAIDEAGNPVYSDGACPTPVFVQDEKLFPEHKETVH